MRHKKVLSALFAAAIMVSSVNMGEVKAFAAQDEQDILVEEAVEGAEADASFDAVLGVTGDEDEYILEEDGAEDPDEPTDPGEPEDPDEPTDPDKPGDPWDPDNPPAPAEPDEPGHDAFDPQFIVRWGKTYCIDIDGYQYFGWFGRRYFDPNKGGAMMTCSFLEYEGATYYLKKDGFMAEGEIITKWNKDYLFGWWGELQYGFNEWREGDLYSDENGVIVKSKFIKDGDDTYYAKATGYLAKNETIVKWGKEYKFDEEGKLIKPELPVSIN